MTHKLLSATIQSWRFAEHIHTAIFIVGLRHDALARESVVFLESSSGQTGLLLAILGLLALLHLRLTNMNREWPKPRDRERLRTETKRAEPKKTGRTVPAKPRHSAQRITTAKTPSNRW